MFPKDDKVAWLNQISLGNVLTICGGIIAVGIMYGAMVTRVNAIETKIDTNDNGDKRTSEIISMVKEKVSEVSSEQKAFRRDIDRISDQLNRIENRIETINRRPYTTP